MTLQEEKVLLEEQYTATKDPKVLQKFAKVVKLIDLTDSKEAAPANQKLVFDKLIAFYQEQYSKL